ncbi:hypothetical protein BKA80DRAFT_74962 [Phyllosticta citrichinensis]
MRPVPRLLLESGSGHYNRFRRFSNGRRCHCRHVVRGRSQDAHGGVENPVKRVERRGCAVFWSIIARVVELSFRLERLAVGGSSSNPRHRADETPCTRPGKRASLSVCATSSTTYAAASQHSPTELDQTTAAPSLQALLSRCDSIDRGELTGVSEDRSTALS